MQPKKLMLLAVIALIAVGIVVELNTQTTSPEQSTPDKLFPNLMDKLNDVDNIEVTNNSEKFTVQFASEQWGLAEKQGYPVKEENVRNVLLGVASLAILEPKTQKPENYAKLGVQDVTEENSDSTLLTLKQGDTVVSSLIVGYDRIARSDNTLREIYVRKPDEAQSWAVEGLLNLEKTSKDWLEKIIINVEGNRIREAVISENGAELVRIFKQQPSDNDYQMANLPEKAMISSSYSINQIAHFLANLNMEDVSVSDSLGAEVVGREIVFTAYDGLQVTLNLVKQNDVYYAKFAAAYVEPTAVEVVEGQEAPSLKSPVEVQQEVAELNEKLASWVYELPRYKANYLFKQPTDLYKIEEEESPIATGSSEQPIFSLEDALSNLSTNTQPQPELPSLQEILGNTAQ
ncbi:DUF4340 domain-containing protein [Candidatus Albibeggiatoa sp. nov. NOAA]|uniref:DUF4340 domain-containing protein n=1 Tax=Candidatus Albibeggiatoa sp. nov. NOAA TaxID=3162724 RepID=UPI0032FD2DFC|nr:DUF4340 domain-containing protein [Thiotrichaceae bacterium]